MTAEVCVPLPVGIGFCSQHGANVEIDGRGRCPEHGELCIWRDDEPRPNLVTERLLVLMDIARVDHSPRVPRHVRPLGGQSGARQTGVVSTRPLLADGTRRWAKGFDACQRCGRTRYPHAGNGLCKACRETARTRAKRLADTNTPTAVGGPAAQAAPGR